MKRWITTVLCVVGIITAFLLSFPWESCHGQEYVVYDNMPSNFKPDSTYRQTVEVLYAGKWWLCDTTIFEIYGARINYKDSMEYYDRYARAEMDSCLHDWVYGRVYLDGLEDVQMVTEHNYRNRICRNCLRHERQAERVYVPPAKMSEYDSLLKELEER